jgi:drug/metabolite transporter (DMT)-like permease
LLSYIYLHQGLARLDLALLLISFVGVVILITGNITSYSQAEPSSTSITLVAIAFVMSMIVPISNSVLMLLMATMKNLSEYTVGCYAAVGLFFFFGPVLAITDSLSDDHYPFLQRFTYIDYLFVIAAGVSSSCVQVCRMKSV